MVRRLVASLLVLNATVLGLAATGEAVGFRIAPHGAKALAMDNAFAAQADDPSAIAYNPAGIVQLEGTQVQGGLSAIYATGSEYEPFPGLITAQPGTGAAVPAGSSDIPGRLFPIPTFFVTHKATDRFSVGFGVYTPYGLQLDWPDDWTGRQITTFSQIRSTYFNLVGAYNVLPRWSVSGGLSYVRSKAKLARTQLTGVAANEALVEFEGEGWALAPDVGTQVRLLDNRLRFGANYRGQAVVEHNGDLKINRVEGGLASVGAQPEQRASATFALPAVFQAGVAVMPARWWTVEFDWDLTFWESFTRLNLTTDNPFLSSTSHRGWHNSHTYRVGTEFKVSDPLAVRFGYAYINTPIPDETLDPVLPDSDRTSLSTGFGYRLTEALTLDVAYEYQYFHERTKNNDVGPTPLAAPGLRANGTYRTDAHAFVVQFRYAF